MPSVTVVSWVHPRSTLHDDSSNKNVFRVTGYLCGEFTGPGELPAQRPVTRSFDVFFDLCLNNGWVKNREAGDLRRHRAHYDVIVMMDTLSALLAICAGNSQEKACCLTESSHSLNQCWIIIDMIMCHSPKALETLMKVITTTCWKLHLKNQSHIPGNQGVIFVAAS